MLSLSEEPVKWKNLHSSDTWKFFLSRQDQGGTEKKTTSSKK